MFGWLKKLLTGQLWQQPWTEEQSRHYALHGTPEPIPDPPPGKKYAGGYQPLKGTPEHLRVPPQGGSGTAPPRNNRSELEIHVQIDEAKLMAEVRRIIEEAKQQIKDRLNDAVKKAVGQTGTRNHYCGTCQPEEQKV